MRFLFLTGLFFHLTVIRRRFGVGRVRYILRRLACRAQPNLLVVALCPADDIPKPGGKAQAEHHNKPERTAVKAAV